MASNEKIVFVTVGTTKFDELIEAVSCQSVRQLERLGYTRLVLQIGRGEYEPESVITPTFRMDVFRFKDSISEDTKSASLVISHAGAGSVLEALGAEKPLLVVINEKLMGNHQMELAYKLHKEEHLFYCTPSQLSKTLEEMDTSTLKLLPPGQPKKFADDLDKFFGFS
ncbi:UDP-N-acetylglucosamine transferase subunit ALG13-like isoform X2 [Ptychodera flava]|uniref:UDP-N-acetylglucosamine transferase subunit ALG13-like isoform X2 n=1 Tax=Ptychodera flava TaxID=63121 RepID=UPI00396A207B